MKTSVLSTTWKNHWLHVPLLELNYKDFSSQGVFISFIDRFLTDSLLQKLKVKSSRVEIQGFRDRIATAIDINRGIQHLDLKGCRYYRDNVDGFMYPFHEFMPLNLYTCKTLVSLKLSRYTLEDGHVVVSLPCLKLMDLRKIRWVGSMTLEKLLSGCPALEELILRRGFYDEPAVLLVKSRSLKRFYVPFKRGYSSFSIEKYILEIDAPELEYMSLKEYHFNTSLVKNLTCLFTIDLDIKFGIVFGPEKRNAIRDFLNGITSVRHMIISQQTVKALDRYSEIEPIPKFSNLSCLQAVFPSSSLQFLPALFESCPNLKHLILKIVYSEETEAFQVINVPPCFVSTLECVEIEGIFDWGEEELKIASYFLENSAGLKKLILRFAHLSYPRQGTDIYEELNKVTKCSRGCRILINYEASRRHD
ncbi:hypothetical protein AALP_AA6G117900 [Arabis alpina]|uniref:FBD domain-containing protein n=1 Tax=Arabis alpina TaxID=50452 RepID=A0A087GNN0_ARAAL|nr:hypothetical protein AALP_AA6G117900 [Arabis alpina]